MGEFGFLCTQSVCEIDYSDHYERTKVVRISLADYVIRVAFNLSISI